MEESITAALGWASLGVRVHPIKRGGKAPALGDGWPHQSTTDEATIRAWFTGSYRGCGLGVQTGGGLVVIDVDSYKPGALDAWKHLLAEYPKTPTYWEKTASGGHHFFYRSARSFKNGEDILATGIDVRASDGGNIVVWPTTGYEIGVDRPMAELPGWLADLLEQPRGKLYKEPKPDPTTDNARNPWWTSKVGELARIHEEDEAAYWVAVRAELPGVVGPGHDEAKAMATAKRVWGLHHRPDKPNETNGFLISKDGRAHSLVKVGKKETGLVPVADGDLRVLGRIIDPEHGAAYRVEITKPGHEPRIGLVDHTILPYHGRFNEWCAGHQLVWHGPTKGARVSAFDRQACIQLYLKAQGGPEFAIAPTLGWHRQEQGFICWEGTITRDGLREPTHIAPDPRLWRDKTAPWAYGFVDHDVWRSAMQEVMTFHEQEYVAVHAAFVAVACLRGMIEGRMRQQPYLAVEASSGAGKTTGYNRLMWHLQGATRDPGDISLAVGRRYACAHNSAYLWIDEPKQWKDVIELVHHSTHRTAIERATGANWERISSTPVMAMVMLSAESLGGADMTSLLDRQILLNPPVLRTRQSLHGDHLQLLDLEEWEQRYPQPWEMAGNTVQALLRQSDVLDDVASLTPFSGRIGDSWGYLRAGARAWSEALGLSWMAEVVDGLAASLKPPMDDRAYFLRTVLPGLILDGWIGTEAGETIPFFYDAGELRLHVRQCSHMWLRRPGLTDRERGLAQESAIRQQLGAAGIDDDGKVFNYRDKKGQRRGRRYIGLGVATATVLDQVGLSIDTLDAPSGQTLTLGGDNVL